MFIVHTMPRHWVYLKMGLPGAYRQTGQADGGHGCSKQCVGPWHAAHWRGGHVQGMGYAVGEQVAALHD